MNQEQIAYVKAQLELGFTPKQIKTTLSKNGYTTEQIDELLIAAKANPPSSQPDTTQPGAAYTPHAPTIEASPNKKSSKLIKILISIAVIIGVIIVTASILGSIVLSSLNKARSNAEDAGVRATLSALRAEAELYHYDNEESYLGFCERVAQTLSSGDCVESQSSYRVSAPLNDGNFSCIDTAGITVVTNAPTGFFCQ